MLRIYDHPLWPTQVILKCDHCPKYITMSRGALRAWAKNTFVVNIGINNAWMMCKGVRNE